MAPPKASQYGGPTIDGTISHLVSAQGIHQEGGQRLQSSLKAWGSPAETVVRDTIEDLEATVLDSTSEVGELPGGYRNAINFPSAIRMSNGDNAVSPPGSLEASLSKVVSPGLSKDLLGASNALSFTSKQVVRVLQRCAEMLGQLEKELIPLKAEKQVRGERLAAVSGEPALDKKMHAEWEGPLPSTLAVAVLGDKHPPPPAGLGRAATPATNAPQMNLPGEVGEARLVDDDMEYTELESARTGILTPRTHKNITAHLEPLGSAWRAEDSDQSFPDSALHGSVANIVSQDAAQIFQDIPERGSMVRFARSDSMPLSMQPMKSDISRRGSGGSMSISHHATEHHFKVHEIWIKSSKPRRMARSKGTKVAGVPELGSVGSDAKNLRISVGVTSQVSARTTEKQSSSEDLVATASFFDEDDAQMVVQESSSPLVRKWIVNPYSMRRSAWDISSMLLVIYDMVTIPLQFFNPPNNTFTDFMAWMTRIFWTLDMPLSFVSGYVKSDGAIEMRPRAIIRRYIFSWLGLDCIVVGVDWMEVVLTSSSTTGALQGLQLGKASRAFRIIRMIRLLRLLRVSEIFGLITERIYSEKWVIVLDILKIACIIMSFAHFIACIWYGIAVGEGAPQNWIYAYNFTHASLRDKYGIALHWSLSQFAGGMDEVTPENEAERAFAIGIFILCFMTASVVVSRLTSSMTQLHIIGSQQSQKLTVLRRYLYQNKISNKLAMRVTRNAQHCIQEQQRLTPEMSVEMLDKISEPLRVELHFEMYTPVLAAHPFFHTYILECPQVMRKVCHKAICISLVARGDVVFSEGEQAAIMYFVVNGALRYFTKGCRPSEVLEQEWVAEATLWTPWVHHGILSASRESRLCKLGSKEFQDIVSQFDHTDFNPKIYAVQFVRMLNTTEDVNDLSPEDWWFDSDAANLNRETVVQSGVFRGHSAATSMNSGNFDSRPSSSFRFIVLINQLKLRLFRAMGLETRQNHRLGVCRRQSPRHSGNA